MDRPPPRPKRRGSHAAQSTAADKPVKQEDAPTTAAPGHQGGLFERSGNWMGEGMFGFRQV